MVLTVSGLTGDVWADVILPAHVGEIINYPENIRSMTTTTIGADAYVVLGTDNGVTLVSIANPASPKQVSMPAGSPGGDVVVARILDETYAISVHSNGMDIIDITNPAEPVPVSSLDGIPAGSGGVDVAYIAGGTYAVVGAVDGIHIVDITNLAEPVRLTPFSVAAVEDVVVAYVTDGTYVISRHVDSVNVIDIGDPAKPKLASSMDAASFPPLAGTGNVAFAHKGTHILATSYENHALNILDITNPKSPALLTTINDGAQFGEMYGSGVVDIFEYDTKAYAMVVSHLDSGIQLVDITHTTHPTPAGEASHGYAFPNMPHIVDGGVISVEDQVLAVTISPSSLHILDITPLPYDVPASPSNPKNIAVVTDGDEFTALGGVRDVETFEADSRTYTVSVGDGMEGMQIIDITNPSNPEPVATVDTGHVPGLTDLREILAVTIGSGKYVLITYDNDVQILNVTNPFNPATVSHMSDGDVFAKLGGAYGIATFVDGSSVYGVVASYRDNGLQIIDMSNPLLPVAVSDVDTYSKVWKVDIVATDAHRYALAISEESVHVVDITVPRSPVYLSDTDRGQFHRPQDILAVTLDSTPYGMVSWFGKSPHPDGISILDLTDPNNPVEIGFLPDTYCHWIAFSVACKATSASGYFPVLGGALDLASISLGTNTFVVVASARDNGVQIINMTDPYSPYAVASLADAPTYVIGIGISSPDIFPALNGSASVAVTNIGTDTVALVAAPGDNSLQIIGMGSSAPTITGLRVNEVRSDAVLISWDAPNADILGYVVQRAEGFGPWTTIQPNYDPNMMSYYDTDLSSFTMYRYSVMALTDMGAGPPSLPVTATTLASLYIPAITITSTPPPTSPPSETDTTPSSTAPGKPTMTASILSGSTVGLSWTVSDTGSTPITHYTVQRTDSASSWTDVTTVNTSEYTDTGLSGDTAYTYRVSGTNSVGTSAWSNEVSVTVPTVPDAPTVTSVTYAQHQNTFRMAWGAPVNDGGSSITAYTIAYRITGTSWTTLTTVSGNTYEISMEMQPPLGAMYAVKATNIAGDSEYSDDKGWSLFSSAAAPGKPTMAASILSGSTVGLSWTVSDTGSTPITHYTVQRTDSASSWTDVTTVNTSEYTDTGLSGDTAYTYRVSGTNSVGTSAWSNEVSVTVPTVPDAPTVTSVTYAQHQNTFRMAWGAPVNDGGSSITAYTIAYRITGTSWTTLTTVSGNTYEISMEMQPPLGAMYAVKATNIAGDSEYSDAKGWSCC